MDYHMNTLYFLDQKKVQLKAWYLGLKLYFENLGYSGRELYTAIAAEIRGN